MDIKYWIRTLILIAIFILLLVIGFKAKAAIAESPIISDPKCESQIDPVKKYACQQVLYHWGITHWQSFDNILERESRWNIEAKNPKSSAYGLCQTMLSQHKVQEDFKTNPYSQVDWCIEYAVSTYRNPNNAWKFWTSHQWW